MHSPNQGPNKWKGNQSASATAVRVANYSTTISRLFSCSDPCSIARQLSSLFVFFVFYYFIIYILAKNELF